MSNIMLGDPEVLRDKLENLLQRETMRLCGNTWMSNCVVVSSPAATQACDKPRLL